MLPSAVPEPARRPQLSPTAATAFGALLLLAVAAGAFWPIVSGRRTVYFGDLGLYFVPQLAFQRRELLVGRLPLWDPYKLCGMPFVGNPQAWPLYPSSLLLTWLDAPVAAGLIGVLHLFLAAVGTLLFLRRRGLGMAACLLGALAFGFGGALVSKMQFPNMVQAGAFLPWLLLGVEGIVVVAAARPGATVRATAGLGFLIGLALLAAHAQMFLMQFYAGMAWAIFRVRQMPSESRRRTVRYLFIALFLGGALAAGQLLPVADHVRASVRTKMTLGGANRFTLTPATLATNFVAPNAFGNPATTDYAGPGNFWEPCAYLGILPFALAVWCAARRFRKSADVRFFALAAFACVWLALGRVGGLYVAAFYLLPGVNKFHDPARWLHVAAFALACLAAFGLEAVGTQLRPGRLRAGVALVVLALSAADLLRFDQTLNPTMNASVWDCQTDAALPPGRVLHADVPNAWKRFVPYRTYGPFERRDEMAASFLATLAPNLTQRAGLLDASGYEPVRGRASDLLLAALLREAKNGDAGSPARHLQAAGVEAILTLRSDAPGAVVQRMSGARAATLFSTWRTARTTDEALTRFLAPDWDGVPIVANAPFPGAGGSGGSAPVAARVERGDGPNELTVWLPPPGRPDAPARLVVVADTNHPGWRAFSHDANGSRRPVAILAANGLFRGVIVSSSTRRVTFQFAPAAFRVGLFVTFVAAGIMGGMWASVLVCPRIPFKIKNRGGVARARKE